MSVHAMESETNLASRHLDRDTKRVIFAAALGTVFEWYDFFVYGSLAAFFSTLFFPKGNETAALLAALATFGAGFVLRPFGAVVFGRLGDLVGRKKTFLATMLVMGLATAAVGLLPTFETFGWWAPTILVGLRLLQGLAVGGEFGGAVTYVAEHSDPDRRGFTTSWIQITATLGLFLSLAVVLLCRSSMSAESFASWGWRLPFVGSIALLVLSLYIRLKMHESPVFQQMKAEGKGSKNPIIDTFCDRRNLRLVLVAIFGVVAGQAVIWYTGHFYSLFFMTTVLKMSLEQANFYLLVALVLGTPFFVFFGWLSDKVGRKPLIIAGCALSALLFNPLFQGLATYGNPALADFRARTSVVIHANDCSEDQSLFGQLFSPQATKECSRVKSFLTARAVPYVVKADAATLTVQIGDDAAMPFDEGKVLKVLTERGLPALKTPVEPNGPMVIAVLFALVFLATMVYGPLGALLVELFPVRIRYSGVSVALQFGNGWIGGFAPFVATAVVIATGNIFGGLWYTIAFAASTAIIGALLLPETRGRDINT
ncbi:MHS family MFS transporter [Bradyrhizobium sp. 24]|uniref:MFS transporter n=1 Tax=unclassified Bradyrhizobium TaxID=2631580 RepID=UPI001FF8E3D1|nr:MULTISPECIES: MFS transporter [unclassified Bradyrhizobium]MCK1296808.1 MHS family MFS transporter [Bradyrhizobium sp. 37]MCK1380167.1 MHS family MFS transporter [Bradyrhizobium sp. 24]MCK1769044.1 MHS family MFS transporter [Bradyrhizobium sp. 134]